MNEVYGNYSKLGKLDTKVYLLYDPMFLNSRKCKINLRHKQSEQLLAQVGGRDRLGRRLEGPSRMM